MKVSWDIFCSVVDNYGDIGVTWRLARQLAAEHDLAVRLWSTICARFAPLCPEADATASEQCSRVWKFASGHRSGWRWRWPT
jgi:hypothetical protein